MWCGSQHARHMRLQPRHASLRGTLLPAEQGVRAAVPACTHPQRFQLLDGSVLVLHAKQAAHRVPCRGELAPQPDELACVR